MVGQICEMGYFKAKNDRRGCDRVDILNMLISLLIQVQSHIKLSHQMKVLWFLLQEISDLCSR